MNSQIEIAIVDDHILFLDAITLLIEGLDPNYKVSRFASPIGLLTQVEQGRVFDLVLCDLIMNTMNGLAFLGALRAQSKSIPLIILSGINTPPPAADIRRIGGNGFVPKSAKNEVLIMAIKTVLAGGSFFRDASGRYIPDQGAGESQRDDVIGGGCDKLPKLGVRQIEVLGLIANGCANKDIARNLSISENTVKTHLKQIFRELGVNKRTACVRKAQVLGLI